MKSFRTDKHRKVLNDLTKNENVKSFERFEKKPKLYKDHISHSHISSIDDKEIELDQSHIVSDFESLGLPYSSELKSSNKQHEIHDNDDTNFNDLANDDDKEIQGPEDNLELDDDFEISEFEDIDDEDEHQHQDDHKHKPNEDQNDTLKPTLINDNIENQENINPLKHKLKDSDIQQSKSNSSESMEPIWNKSIFNELEIIMKKYSSKLLDENDEDTFDVTMVAEYSPEIFNYMHQLEYKLLPEAGYMDKQDELKWEMRSVLIDWVVQVHSRFNLLPETLYLTVNYIDRFLSKRKVSLSRFQLVGAVALFIAAKYEEINCPTIQEVAYMADNAYSIDDFLKAERFMIDVLEFDMGWPGPMSFLRRTSKADDYDYETRTLAKYLIEVTIMDSRFVASQPSWLAAGAHYLSRKLLNRGSWTELHVFYSGYTESQLKPLATTLLKICENAETHHKAIFEKYQERKYRRSSIYVQECLEIMKN